MRRIEIHLSEPERQELRALLTKGVHPARELTRAHILVAADQGVPDQQIQAVLGVSRMVLWRTRAAYQEKGLAYALEDAPRCGGPPRHPRAQAEVVALACSQPPPGRKRWTIQLLTEAARESLGLPQLGLETVRQYLKKKRAQALA